MKVIKIEENIYSYLVAHKKPQESINATLERLLNIDPNYVSKEGNVFSNTFESNTSESNVSQNMEKSVAVNLKNNENKTENNQNTNVLTKKIKFSQQNFNFDDDLYEKVNTDLRKLIVSDEFLESLAVGRFLSVLSLMYKILPQQFTKAAHKQNGRVRLYFASQPSDFSGGNSTKPKAIPNSPLWVETNNNSSRKLKIMTSIMQDLEVDKKIITQIKPFFAKKAEQKKLFKKND